METLTMPRHSETYQLRLDPDIKRESFAVFYNLGITPAQGMRLFLSSVARTQSIPFPIEYTPNAETIKVIEETEAGKNLNTAKSVDDLFHQLGI